MTREKARQIIATWLVSSKGTKRQRGYIEGWFDEEDVEAFRVAIEALQADRPRGEWIAEEEYGDLWVCDQCGFASEYKDNFCPNCGAKMDGK